MDGFEKSAKTTRTPLRVPFQTKTRTRAATEAAAAKVSAVETAAANTIPIPSPHDTCLVAGGARSVTDARVMTDDSLTVANVSPTVDVLQPTLLHDTLLEL